MLYIKLKLYIEDIQWYTLRYVLRKVLICKKCQKLKKKNHFYFLNFDFSFAFQKQCIIFYTIIHNDPTEGSMSQNLDLGLSYFYDIKCEKI